jgi:hypothetical protein
MGESKYRPDMSINVVLEQLYNGQKILPDDSVQKGSVVDLVLGKGLSNELTSVPFLVGMHLGRAKNKILLSSLNLGGYIYDNTVINKNDTLNALVYKQKPEYKPDASMQLGSTIYLFLTVDKAKLQADSTLLTISDTISTVAPVSRISN